MASVQFRPPPNESQRPVITIADAVGLAQCGRNPLRVFQKLRTRSSHVLRPLIRQLHFAT
jgi:hypothetical protein